MEIEGILRAQEKRLNLGLFLGIHVVSFAA